MSYLKCHFIFDLIDMDAILYNDTRIWVIWRSTLYLESIKSDDDDHFSLDVKV